MNAASAGLNGSWHAFLPMVDSHLQLEASDVDFAVEEGRDRVRSVELLSERVRAHLQRVESFATRCQQQ